MFYLVVCFKKLNHFFHMISIESLHHQFHLINCPNYRNELGEFKIKCKPHKNYTSKNPKSPELISPAGNPIAIIFSVIYVISKSNPPSCKLGIESPYNDLINDIVGVDIIVKN